MTTNNINSNNLKFADYLKDSPFIMFIVSLLYGLSLYLYFNFRLNPEWGGGVGDDERYHANLNFSMMQVSLIVERNHDHDTWGWVVGSDEQGMCRSRGGRRGRGGLIKSCDDY